MASTIVTGIMILPKKPLAAALADPPPPLARLGTANTMRNAI
jgi:hypothetical protein